MNVLVLGEKYKAHKIFAKTFFAQGILIKFNLFLHSATNAPEDDVPNRYSRTDRTGYGRYSRDANSSGNSVPSIALEKRIEELERVNTNLTYAQR